MDAKDQPKRRETEYSPIPGPQTLPTQHKKWHASSLCGDAHRTTVCWHRIHLVRTAAASFERFTSSNPNSHRISEETLYLSLRSVRFEYHGPKNKIRRASPLPLLQPVTKRGLNLPMVMRKDRQLNPDELLIMPYAPHFSYMLGLTKSETHHPCGRSSSCSRGCSMGWDSH